MNKKEKSQLSVQVLKKFRVIFGSVRNHFREIEQTCGVSGSQLWLMQEIQNAPGIGVSELAERMCIHQSTCSQLVEKLTASSLVIKERSKEDQRRVGLHLSEAARTMMESAPGPAEGVLPGAVRALPEDAMLALDESLSRVIEHLQVKDDSLAGKPLGDM